MLFCSVDDIEFQLAHECLAKQGQRFFRSADKSGATPARRQHGKAIEVKLMLYKGSVFARFL